MISHKLVQFNIQQQPHLSDIIMAMLSEEGYDGFEETEDAVLAYIEPHAFNAAVIDDIKAKFNIEVTITDVEKQNWNSVWESYYEPVVIDDFVAVRAHFHPAFNGVQHDILITPKMSFGTGHHATTSMMMQLMKDIDFNQKQVLDYGTGTGILAILAEKLGATTIVAIDYDTWCMENAAENIDNNQCTAIQLIQANHPQTSQYYDVLIANINRNILIDNATILTEQSHPKSLLLLSGLLDSDEHDIVSLYQSLGWKLSKVLHQKQWIAILMHK